jgi:hypothetical protein
MKHWAQWRARNQLKATFQLKTTAPLSTIRPRVSCGMTRMTGRRRASALALYYFKSLARAIPALECNSFASSVPS